MHILCAKYCAKHLHKQSNIMFITILRGNYYVFKKISHEEAETPT